jgi:uncharacterized protein (TIGR00730 family)
VAWLALALCDKGSFGANMPVKSYKNLEFLNSPEARAIRILCEYEEPKRRFEQENVENTVVFFGSARARPLQDVLDEKARLTKEAATSPALQEELEEKIQRLERVQRLSPYYEKTRALARKMTEWDLEQHGSSRFLVSTGGGPGIMEAANRGAADVPGGKSVGLGISLPFEESLNQYITPELGFEFHYFFTRKYWFLYLCKAMVVCPGGFGTMDELFETLTLRQTGKIKKNIPTVLFGTEYWSSVLNIESMMEWGTISPKDLDLVFITDSVDEAFEYLCNGLKQEGELP